MGFELNAATFSGHGSKSVDPETPADQQMVEPNPLTVMTIVSSLAIVLSFAAYYMSRDKAD